MRRSTSRLTTAVFAAAVLLLAACGADDASPPEEGAEGVDDGGGDDQAVVADTPLGIAVASFDLAAGQDRRLIAGVLTAEAMPIVFGEVQFALAYLGEEPSGEATMGEPQAARFLPVPGLEPQASPTDRPSVLVGDSGMGVYEARVDLEEPGFYGLQVVVELEDGTTREGQATFEVLPEPEVPDIGDEAPRSVNLTIADVEAGDVPPVAVDSRAQSEDDEVPDPLLHDSTVADALDAGRPVVVALSTPTYCVSAFCGPLTSQIATLAENHDGDVDFVHIEVWRDFEARELNEAASEWIQTETGGNEPWVFLVDGDGIVQGRWDNVLDLADLEQRLSEIA